MLSPADGSAASPSTKAAAVVLPRDATAGETIQLGIDACLTHLRPNEACWLAAEHPDCLHQTRVSTRRLRALLSLSRRLLRDDPVAMELKDRLRVTLMPLGPARDLDVALARALEEGWADSDVDRLRRARAATAETVREVLAGREWQRLWADLEQWRHAPGWLGHVAAWRDGPARAVTDEALDRRHRRVMLAGPYLTRMSEHALHRVRIEGKKLRYGAQFFDTLYPDAGTRVTEDGRVLSVPLYFAEEVAVLQDAFGAFNDRAVAVTLHRDLGLEHPLDDHRPSRDACVAAWTRVAALPPFWRQA